MQKQQKNKFYNEFQDRIIYILYFPTNKKFYINQCLKTSLKETYRHHLKGRRYSTKEFIEEQKPLRPCLLVLEKIPNITKAEANNYLLIWLKILIENKFISVNNPKIIGHAQQLYFKNTLLYEKRKNSNIQFIVSCKSCAVPTYKNQICTLQTEEGEYKK